MPVEQKKTAETIKTIRRSKPLKTQRTSAEVFRIETFGDIAKYRREQDKKQISNWMRQQAELERYEDIRDDLISAIKNWAAGQHKNFEEACELIHGQCGPHPSTLHSWEQKKISKPQMGKIISVLRIIGVKLSIG